MHIEQRFNLRGVCFYVLIRDGIEIDSFANFNDARERLVFLSR